MEPGGVAQRDDVRADSGVLLVILYAYFGQAARAQTADRVSPAHGRIDLA